MYLFIAAIAFILWMVWALSFSLLAFVGHPVLIEKLGQWGDSFGALNTMFSGFAFLAVVFTIRQQQEQIKKAQQQNQNERFERVFFDLLRLLRESRDEVRFQFSREVRKAFDVKNDIATGRKAFRNAWDEISHLIDDPELSSEQIASIYEDRVHRRFESSLGPYFRVLYTILQRIKMEDALDADDRFRYGNLLRSQFSSSELAVMALNGLSPISKDLKSLIVEFRMLKYLPETLNRRKILERYYPETAFAARD